MWWPSLCSWPCVRLMACLLFSSIALFLRPGVLLCAAGGLKVLFGGRRVEFARFPCVLKYDLPHLKEGSLSPRAVYPFGEIYPGEFSFACVPQVYAPGVLLPCSFIVYTSLEACVYGLLANPLVCFKVAY